MYAAYEALSDRMKTYLEGLTALHDGEQTLSRHCTPITASPTSPTIPAPSIRWSAPIR
jgi:hypothetical protein